MECDISTFHPSEMFLADDIECDSDYYDGLTCEEQDFLKLYDQINGRYYNPDEKISDDRISRLMSDILYKDCFVVRTDNDEIIGVGVCYSDPDESKTWISAISVDESYQSKGIGSKILDHIEKLAKEENMSKVALRSVFGAEGFYEHRGYNEADIEDNGLLKKLEKIL